MTFGQQSDSGQGGGVSDLHIILHIIVETHWLNVRASPFTKERTMKYLRCFAGLVLMLAGAAGLVLSALAIGGVHQASTSVSRQTTDILDSTKEAVVFLK